MIQSLAGTLFLLVFTVVSGGMVGYGLATGEIYTKIPRWTKRAESPIMFWWAALMWSILCCAGLAMLIANIVE